MSITSGSKITTLMVSALNGDTYGDPQRRLFRGIQSLVMPNVISVYGNTPPVSPTNGQTYIVGSAPVGLWSGQANAIAYWAVDAQDQTATTGIWEFYAPQNGWKVYNQAAGSYVMWNGSVWVLGHLTGNADLAGTVTIAAGQTSASVTFSIAFGSAPVVVLTPTSSTTTSGIGKHWVVSTTAGFTVHCDTISAGSPPPSVTFNYIVAGNPN